MSELRFIVDGDRKLFELKSRIAPDPPIKDDYVKVAGAMYRVDYRALRVKLDGSTRWDVYLTHVRDLTHKEMLANE